MNRDRFARAMAALGEAFSQEASPAKVELFYKALGDLTIDQFEQAVWTVINTRVTATFPKVAEIRAALTGDSETVAQIALDKAEDAVGTYGAYRCIAFDDPIIHSVLERFGGWVKWCETPVDEMKWIRRDFLRYYQHYMSQPPEGQVKLLGGIGMVDNAAFGEPPDIGYVGDVTRAKALIADELKLIETSGPDRRLQRG